VKRRVYVGETAVDRGGQAKGGDKVKTGWFSYALIASDGSRAKFEIFSSTDVTLADGTPGVLISVERGRIRAAFDKITGSEPRVVKTPGALLAVRGTQFDVEVDSEGHTTVDVFEGTVEIQSAFRPEPLFVHAGEQSRFGRREPPTSRPMPEDRRREGPGGKEGRDGENRPPDDGRGNRDSRGGDRRPDDGRGDRPPAAPGGAPGGGGAPPPRPPRP
jgi:hypothetical protein